jgi:hypothetical protein
MHKEKKIGIFNLLMPKRKLISESNLGIDIGAYHYSIEKQSKPIPDLVNTYTCVSYSWGNTREPNPLQQGYDMSGRAMTVLETAIRVLGNYKESSNKVKSSPAIWIDTFCVSPNEREKETCLRSMGAIYGNASKVLVVLLPSLSAVLKQVRENDKIDIETLPLFEQDDWAMRVWTYQEIVNSKALYFIAEGEHEMPVKGHDFFDAIAKSRDDFAIEKGYDLYDLRSKLPRLMSLESTLLDWRMGGYLGRSTYQVILSIECRKASQASDMVHAMIGAITSNLDSSKDILSLSLEESFMQACEDKNDFSFIYTTTRRSKIKGKFWRPVAEKLQVVFPYIDCTGEGQPGKIFPTHLQLDNVCKMSIGTAPEKKIASLIKFIGNVSVPRKNWTYFILELLRKRGFKGCGDFIQLEHGYFFSQEPIPDSKDIHVIVTKGVKYVFGAPGLLVKGNDTDIYRYCGVGFFFGHISKSNTVSINLS